MTTPGIYEQRSESRGEARTYVHVRNGFTKTGGMVVDISMGGIEIEMHSTSGMNFGDAVELHGDKIGYIDGTVRWVKPRRIGIEFTRSSNNSAKVAAFLKNFRIH